MAGEESDAEDGCQLCVRELGTLQLEHVLVHCWRTPIRWRRPWPGEAASGGYVGSKASVETLGRRARLGRAAASGPAVRGGSRSGPAWSTAACGGLAGRRAKARCIFGDRCLPRFEPSPPPPEQRSGRFAARVPSGSDLVPVSRAAQGPRAERGIPLQLFPQAPGRRAASRVAIMMMIAPRRRGVPPSRTRVRGAPRRPSGGRGPRGALSRSSRGPARTSGSLGAAARSRPRGSKDEDRRPGTRRMTARGRGRAAMRFCCFERPGRSRQRTEKRFSAREKLLKTPGRVFTCRKSCENSDPDRCGRTAVEEEGPAGRAGSGL